MLGMGQRISTMPSILNLRSPSPHSLTARTRTVPTRSSRSEPGLGREVGAPSPSLYTRFRSQSLLRDSTEIKLDLFSKTQMINLTFNLNPKRLFIGFFKKISCVKVTSSIPSPGCWQVASLLSLPAWAQSGRSWAILVSARHWLVTRGKYHTWAFSQQQQQNNTKEMFSKLRILI